MSEKIRITGNPIEIHLSISPRLGCMVDELADRIGKEDSAAVFGLAIWLLKIAVDAKAEGNRLAIVDGELEEVIQEILVPGFGTSEPTEEATP